MGSSGSPSREAGSPAGLLACSVAAWVPDQPPCPTRPANEEWLLQGQRAVRPQVDRWWMMEGEWCLRSFNSSGEVSIANGLEPGVVFSYNFIYSLDGPQCASRWQSSVFAIDFLEAAAGTAASDG